MDDAGRSLDGSSKPFSIGLKPIAPAEWIALPDDLDHLLTEKARLMGEIPREVFAEEPGSRPAQREVLERLCAAVTATHPAVYRREGGVMMIGADRRIDLADDASPLQIAASMVADDLLLMQRDVEGWRLVAASLCFPSSWTLSEKFGRPLHAIHDPVPDFGTGTRMAALIERIFDNLQPDQSVIRWNWSLQTDHALYKPLSTPQRDARATLHRARFARGAADAIIRVERQTLTKLPRSGLVLFTIGIGLDPMAALAAAPEGQQRAASLAAQLRALTPDQRAYKGLSADAERLATDLDLIASGATRQSVHPLL